MTELDVETLKRLNEAWKNGKRYYGVGDVANQMDAIIAALEDLQKLQEVVEDRDRLRAENDKVRRALSRVVMDNHIEEALAEVWAVLEGRDG